MQLEALKEGIGKLERRFGRRPLNQEAIADLYELLGTIPDNSWAEIVDKFYKYERHFPTPGEIEAVWREIRTRPENRAAKRYWCLECRGAGGYVVKGLTVKTPDGHEKGPDDTLYIRCECQPEHEYEGEQGRVRGMRANRARLRSQGATIIWPTFGVE